jgi:hypothetical protein
LAGWPLESLYLIERVPKDVADARHYDEASAVEKVDIDIGRLQQRTGALKRLGAGKEAFAELAEEMAKLHRRKAELQATQSPMASPGPQQPERLKTAPSGLAHAVLARSSVKNY